MPLKFIVKTGPAGKFAFSVVSRNGRVIATSDEYSSRAAAMSGVRSIQSQAGDAPIEDQSTKAWANGEQSRQATTTKRAAKHGAARAVPRSTVPRRAVSKQAPEPSVEAIEPAAPQAAPEAAPELVAAADTGSEPTPPAPEPEVEPAAASFAEPELGQGPKRISMRSAPAAVPEGHTRRVVSMRDRS